MPNIIYVNRTNLGRHNSTHAPHNSTHAPHNSTHAPTSPSLLNTHQIPYPHPTPTPLHHTQKAYQSVAAYKFVVNLST